MFLTILITSLTSLIALTAIGFTVFASSSQYPSSWMSDMWNQMSGSGMMIGTTSTTAQNPQNTRPIRRKRASDTGKNRKHQPSISGNMAKTVAYTSAHTSLYPPYIKIEL